MVHFCVAFCDAKPLTSNADEHRLDRNYYLLKIAFLSASNGYDTIGFIMTIAFCQHKIGMATVSNKSAFYRR